MVRVCVTPGIAREEAHGHGRIAVAGLSNGPISVQAQHIDDGRIMGQTRAVTLDEEQPWAEAVWETCADECSPCAVSRDDQASDETTALLVIAFGN